MRLIIYILSLVLLTSSVSGQMLVNPYIGRATSAPAPPAPSLPTTDMYAHYKLNSAGIVHASNVVSQFNDLSGNGRDVSQATSTRRPTWNGTDAVTFSFNGISSTDDAMPLINGSLAYPITMYFVVTITAPNTNYTPFLYKDNNLASVLSSYFLSANLINFYPGADFSDAPYTAGTRVIVRFVINGASSLMQINNNTASTFSSTATLTNIGLGGIASISTGQLILNEAVLYTSGSVDDAAVKAVLSAEWSISL